jgi:hypothetical protein
MVNIITNGTFTSATPSPDLDPVGWTVVETAPGDLQVINGAVHFNSALFANLGSSMSQVVQGAPIGETVNFSFTYSETGVGGGSKSVDVTVLDQNGNIIYDQTVTSPGNVNFSFTSTTNNYTVIFADGSSGGALGNPVISNVVFDVPFVVCFAKDTRILTESGEIAVQALRIGDKVITRDNGAQEICWIGSKTVMGSGDFAPVLFQQGAMGNTRDLRVSPQHRVLLTDWRAELLFGASEILVPAQSMVNGRTIRREYTSAVTYYHLLFAHHQVICSDGLWSESFFPGAYALRGIDQVQRQEVLSLFPQLAGGASAYGPSARLGIGTSESRLLVA